MERAQAAAVSFPSSLFLVAALAAALPAARAADPAREARAASVELVRDASVAESVRRGTNIDFESVRVDGQRSSASLSALAADQVLRVEAAKVATPDLDADTVGGLLRVTTRRAYDQAGRTLRGEFTAGYDELARRFAPDLSVTFGDSFGRDRRFGFLGTVRHAGETRVEEAVELDWSRAGTRLDETGIEWSRERSRETDFNGTLDWKLGPESFVFLRLDGSLVSARDLAHEFGYKLAGAPVNPPPGGVILEDATGRRSLQGGDERERNVALAAGASLRGERWQIELKFSRADQADRRFGDRRYEFARDELLLRYRRLEPAFPQLDPIPSGDPAPYRLDELEVAEERRHERDSVVALDLTRAHAWGGRPGWLKFGGKARRLHTRNEEIHRFHREGPAGLRWDDVPAGPQGGAVLGDRYRFAEFPDWARLNRLLDTEPARFAFDADRTRGETDPVNYAVHQDVFAAYGLAGTGFGATRILLGARVERTDNAFTAHEVVFDEAGRYEATRPVAAENRYLHWFPGVHLTHALSSKLTLFGSWTRSIVRPDYTDLAPSRRVQRSDRELEEGNPHLRATLYTNFDAALDYAYAEEAGLSLQLFHRMIADPTLERTALLADGPFAGFERSRPENADGATLSGLDLTWRQPLGALDGASLEVTYTRRRSEQTLAGRPGETLPLAGEPGHELNASLSYERGRYEIGIRAGYAGRTLRAAGRSAAEDVFSAASTRWEIALSRRMRAGGRLVLEIENLSARPELDYQGDPSRPSEYERASREYRLGYRWEL